MSGYRIQRKICYGGCDRRLDRQELKGGRPDAVHEVGLQVHEQSDQIKLVLSEMHKCCPDEVSVDYTDLVGGSGECHLSFPALVELRLATGVFHEVHLPCVISQNEERLAAPHVKVTHQKHV